MASLAYVGILGSMFVGRVRPDDQQEAIQFATGPVRLGSAYIQRYSSYYQPGVGGAELYRVRRPLYPAVVSCGVVRGCRYLWTLSRHCPRRAGFVLARHQTVLVRFRYGASYSSSVPHGSFSIGSTLAGRNTQVKANPSYGEISARIRFTLGSSRRKISEYHRDLSWDLSWIPPSTRSQSVDFGQFR